MHKLLKFEYRRLFYRVSLYVCLAIVLVPVLFTFFTCALSYLEAKTSDSYSFSAVSNTMYGIMYKMISSANLTLLSVIFTSIFVCEDSTRGTVKTIYSLGYPRFKLFLAKFIASTTATAIMYFVIILIALICGAFFSISSEESTSNSLFGMITGNKEPDIVLFIIQQFAVIMGAHAFYYLMAQLSQKTGISIVLGIFIPSVISSFLGIIAMILLEILNKNKVLSEVVMDAYMTFLKYWLPSTLGSILSSIGLSSDLNYGVSIMVNIGYIVVFGALAVLVNNKKEIK